VEISGYVNVALRDSRRLPSNRGIFVEQIEPQVFQRALDRTDDVKLLFNHKEDRQLGSQKQGNLTLREDAIGLYAQCSVSDPEVIEKARNDELRGWSFGFISRSDEWDTTANPQRRFVKDLDLLEVSILSVTPAYTAMSLETREDETVIIEQRFDLFEDREMSKDMKKKHQEMMDEDPDKDNDSNSDNDSDGDGADPDNDGDSSKDNDQDGDGKKKKRSYDYSFFEKEIEILRLRGVCQ
jgi:HK97 family phage prohead protease